MDLLWLFMKFDGHYIKYGVKIAAISLHGMIKHRFLPEKINFSENSLLELKGVDQIGMRNFIEFCNIHKFGNVEHKSKDYKKYHFQN